MAINRICSIPDCGNPLKSSGLCIKHYTRWYKYGDTSTVKATPNGEAREYYENVVLKYEGDECLVWPYSRSTSGYGQARWNNKTSNVSRFVCEDVYGEPPTAKHEAAHSCGKGHLGCVSKSHLSWKSPSENQMDKVAHGTHSRGERGALAKLTRAEVIEINSLRGTKKKCEIAAVYGVNPSTISRIHAGKRWQDEHASEIL
ncbi:hypothetical protein [Rhizobium mesoamericanum]|uniref:hypothetical protein n=1 Tax=Rhizobium mesoamericanum TaxID=1079800 RepID=UPI0012DDC78A|nr:hypothetical protein [Rhizobium mesoamericanum]